MRFESAAPSRGTKRARPKLENLQTPKPQPRPHTLPGLPQNRERKTFGPQISDFVPILGSFLLSQKTSKFRLRPKRPKISKIGSRNVFGSDVGRFWHPFWHPFSLYFTNRRKRLFCNKYQAKRLFLPPKPFHFGTNCRSIFHVFSGIVFEHLFFIIFPR